ncbi:MAG: tRNA (N(6)-L-threonylcarbamoyladenosine(37)-C(2))-methylthiotransferase MtaB [Clostridia bacterium]|nr:tRNA (N(6)-L-threonylcarbamoyladenosine(37)-C(2))-methylthiotransferase MtaB [Clostridia bacterium]
MKKISIITLGCKVNQVESESIGEKLESFGYDVSMGLGTSDIYVINTCAVTNEAERKSRNYISKILKLNKNAEIYVCGCSSQKGPENFTTKQNVKYVIGTENKIRLADKILQNDNFKSANNKVYRITTRTRADLWVQNGCNNFCTYCIIPYLRGREVSFPLEEIKDELEKICKIAKEIVITGINLSAYGKDIPGSDGLIEIARLFKNKENRFRFSSLEVNVITDEFLKELSTYKNFCDQFHLSLQSGSNNTLKHMNRHYTKEDFKTKVDLIRKYFPNAGITTDIIIGFATETEEDFEESLNFVRDVKFSDMHIFPYSIRSGTAAEKFKMVAKNVDDRVKKMTELATQNRNEFITKNIGKIHEVIIENEKNGYYLAHTKNFILCYIPSNEKLKSNEIKQVLIKEIYNDGALAEIVN